MSTQCAELTSTPTLLLQNTRCLTVPTACCACVQCTYIIMRVTYNNMLTQDVLLCLQLALQCTYIWVLQCENMQTGFLLYVN